MNITELSEIPAQTALHAVKISSHRRPGLRSVRNRP